MTCYILSMCRTVHVFREFPISSPVAAAKEHSHSLIFLLSSLISCLDCACDSHHAVEIISCISGCVGVVLTHAEGLAPQNTPLTEQIVSPLLALLRMLLRTNVLQRAVHMVASSSYCGIEEDLCLQSLIALIQCIVRLCPVEILTRASSARFNGEEQKEDLHGGIDDALIASIDLGEGTTRERNTMNDSMRTIANFLAELLDKSKPSSRNAIFRPPSVCSVSVAAMSAQGMKLISKRSDMICSAFAEIVAKADVPVPKLWRLPSRFHACHDQGDTEYAKHLAIFLTRQLCSRHQSLVVHEIVRQDMEEMLFNMLEALLDSKMLRKVPSSNLNRIGKSSGSEGEEKSFTQLMNFRDGLPRSLHDSLDTLRSFCDDFGRLLLQLKGNDPNYPHGRHFREYFRKSSDTRTKQQDSLEQECFNRFVLLRHLLTLQDSRHTI